MVKPQSLRLRPLAALLTSGGNSAPTGNWGWEVRRGRQCRAKSMALAVHVSATDCRLYDRNFSKPQFSSSVKRAQSQRPQGLCKLETNLVTKPQHKDDACKQE